MGQSQTTQTQPSQELFNNICDKLERNEALSPSEARKYGSGMAAGMEYQPVEERMVVPQWLRNRQDFREINLKDMEDTERALKYDYVGLTDDQELRGADDVRELLDWSYRWDWIHGPEGYVEIGIKPAPEPQFSGQKSVPFPDWLTSLSGSQDIIASAIREIGLDELHQELSKPLVACYSDGQYGQYIYGFYNLEDLISESENLDWIYDTKAGQFVELTFVPAT